MVTHTLPISPDGCGYTYYGWVWLHILSQLALMGVVRLSLDGFGWMAMALFGPNNTEVWSIME